VREYTETYYLPAAELQRQRSDNRAAVAADLVDWQRLLRERWPNLRFGQVSATTTNGLHHFQAELYLEQLDPAWIAVEVYANGVNGSAPLRQAAALAPGTRKPGVRMFEASIPAARPASDFTLRVIPKRKGVAVPLEAPEILWQR
jgi:starch phosphorylase